MTEEFYIKKYPITDSLYTKSGYAGHCNICDELTLECCDTCPKWLCNDSHCHYQHGKDETEGWR